MITSKRRVVTFDGKDYIVIKASNNGPKDRLLTIGPDGENHIIDVKHLDYLGTKPRTVTIKVD